MVEDIPKEIAQDVMKIGDLELRVAILDSGERVIYKEDMIKFLEWLGRGNEREQDSNSV